MNENENSELFDEVEELVQNWLCLPDVATHLGVEVSKVRRMVETGELIAIRRGEPRVKSVPQEFLDGDQVIPYLAGTITLLRDQGFNDLEVLTWLFTADDTLPGRPVDHLRQGQRGEVRRRAQVAGF